MVGQSYMLTLVFSASGGDVLLFQCTTGMRARLAQAVYYDFLVVLCFIGLYWLLYFLVLDFCHCADLFPKEFLPFFT